MSEETKKTSEEQEAENEIPVTDGDQAEENLTPEGEDLPEEENKTPGEEAAPEDKKEEKSKTSFFGKKKKDKSEQKVEELSLEAERKEQFMGDFSHEIKTPLTVILGAVETLQDGALQEPESAARFMEIITQHASRLNALVQDILSLSNLEQQHLNRQQDFTVVDAAVTIANAVEYCRPRADEKGVVLELNVAGKVLVKADPQLLEQAVVNLVDNAVKYSGSVRPIQISLRPDDGYCRIGVTDFGIGIAAEHLDRLFERFYRVDKARSRKLGGTGLGLAIVKHIVQLHGGEIAVRSVVGSGSTFVIKLPLAAVPAGKN